jgi:uncharacterized membrane protein YdjX (TVP38/TMEM64 family)
MACSFVLVKSLLDGSGLEQQLVKSSSWFAVLFLVFFIVTSSLGFPGNILSVAAGAIFGVFWGIVISQIGSTVGAIGSFGLARYLLHDFIQYRFGSKPLLQKLNRTIAHNSLSFVIATRLSPLAPFTVLNFLFGLTPVTLKTYALGTFLGIIPLTITYVWIGVTGKSVINGGDRLPLLLAFTLLTLLSLFPLVFKQHRPQE